MSARYIYRMLIIVTLIFPGRNTTYSQEPAQGVFEHELTFGTKNLPEEFRLSQTVDIIVDDEGIIYVADANLVKIFDSEGNGLAVIGGSGEYSSLTCIDTVPSGYITVQSIDGFSLFSKNLSFLEKRIYTGSQTYLNLIVQLKLHMPDLDRIVALNEYEHLFSGEAAGFNADKEEIYLNALVYNDNDSLRIIAQYQIMNKLWTGKVSHTLNLLGDLHWTVLPERRIIYTHTGHDRRIYGNYGVYTLHRRSLDHEEVLDIHVPYILMKYPDNLLEKPGPGLYQVDMSINDIRKEFRKKYLEVKYIPPVKELITDGRVLFAVTFLQNKQKQQLVDIIDTETGTVINTKFIPFVPHAIKNGRAYFIKWEEQKQPEIEIYRINPVLYRR